MCKGNNFKPTKSHLEDTQFMFGKPCVSTGKIFEPARANVFVMRACLHGKQRN